MQISSLAYLRKAKNHEIILKVVDYYKTILQENLDGVSEFVKGMLYHQGNFHIDKLRVVKINNGVPTIRMGKESDKFNDYAIGTGGEVVNSYCTLYEVGYIFICLFLAGVGTAILNKKLFNKYQNQN